MTFRCLTCPDRPVVGDQADALEHSRCWHTDDPVIPLPRSPFGPVAVLGDMAAQVLAFQPRRWT